MSARKKTSTRRRAQLRPVQPPVSVSSAAEVETILAPAPEIGPTRRIEITDCINVNVTCCRDVIVSDNGAYIRIEGEGHGPIR